jgi:hypothetical protein
VRLKTPASAAAASRVSQRQLFGLRRFRVTELDRGKPLVTKRDQGVAHVLEIQRERASDATEGAPFPQNQH